MTAPHRSCRSCGEQIAAHYPKCPFCGARNTGRITNALWSGVVAIATSCVIWLGKLKDRFRRGKGAGS